MSAITRRNTNSLIWMLLVLYKTKHKNTQSSVAALAMLLPLEQRQLQQTLKKVNRLKFDWKNPAEILSIICCFAEDIEHTQTWMVDSIDHFHVSGVNTKQQQ